VAGKGKKFTIVSGERRYRALKLLEERGELPNDFAVPVEIRQGLSNDEALRITTVENLQRATLAPLEETAALTKLVHKGAALDDVSAQTGLSVTTIKRRLVLNSLCRDAKEALRAGEVTLAQAEALTRGSHEAQRGILEEIASRRSEFTAEDIRASFLDARSAVSMAIFPLEQYTGTLTTDLFANEETSYFDDAEHRASQERGGAEGAAG
jgi:ParB-like chromosome segregation protein Spo0J